MYSSAAQSPEQEPSEKGKISSSSRVTNTLPLSRISNVIYPAEKASVLMMKETMFKVRE
jgi:hypothetical protein